jgi:hypothetical protein
LPFRERRPVKGPPRLFNNLHVSRIITRSLEPNQSKAQGLVS